MHHLLRPVLAAGIRSFAYHGGDAPVLSNVDLELAPGTLTAVLGASGSGKTTLGRLLAGWVSPGTGGVLAGFLELAGTRLEFDGSATDPRVDPAQWGRMVGFVPQDAAAILSTVKATVAEELAFGLENAGMDRADMRAAVEHTAGLLGLTGLLERDPARLSGGQLRRLAIGCAIITRPPVLVMDEPFASLDAAGVREVGALVRSLTGAGTAVVILSQALDAPLLDAATWVVLAEGTVGASGPPAHFQPGGALPADIRRPHQARPRETPVSRRGGSTAPALELRNVTFGYRQDTQRRRRGFMRKPSQDSAAGSFPFPVLQGIDLAVHPGEVVAITGPNGTGKSTLLRHFNGLLRPGGGTVRVLGADIARTPVGSTAASVGLLFQQPRDQLFERTALREVRFGLDPHLGRAGAVERAMAALAAVGLEGGAQAHPMELPASRQRLLALATALARRPAVLALDEPTVALDVGGLAVLDAAVRSTAEEGAAVVLVTHDLAYARQVAHRILSLEGGRLVEA